MTQIKEISTLLNTFLNWEGIGLHVEIKSYIRVLIGDNQMASE